ncbi:uncharacterized protein BJX67DRAFT_378144 [Aspergillus lucknowensis]|uniref:Rhodopsin domain-containing protein n=1 Tax=Aspergillus lucknowensis TaxID=176173 RepID=A0ABR4M264_9EURO
MGPYVPSGQSPPFQVVDELHHGAWVIIAVALGLVVSLVSFLIRVYVRLALNPPFANDDFVLLGATIFAVIQASLLFGACSEGLGTSIDLLTDRQVDNSQILLIVSDIIYLITLYTTKCCVTGIYIRLTPQKLHNRASWGTLILCTCWGPEGDVRILYCTPSVIPKLAKWQFIVALDIATELILFVLAVLLLAGLFMPLKRKFTIAFAFVFRLPMIIFAILHIYHLRKNIGSPDPPLDAVPSIIWAQVELNYALVACSVFCLRPFMAAVSTNYGTAGDSTLESSRDASKRKSSGSKSNSGSRSLNRGTASQAVALGFSRTNFGATKGVKAQDARVRAHLAGEEIELVDQGRGGRNAGCEGSAKMVIRKDVQYTVEYDGGESRAGANLQTGNESERWNQYLETPGQRL